MCGIGGRASESIASRCAGCLGLVLGVGMVEIETFWVPLAHIPTHNHMDTNTRKQNGDCYEGEWRDHDRTGRGVFKGADGASYDGGWEVREKERDGVGLFFFKILCGMCTCMSFRPPPHPHHLKHAAQ